MFGVLKMRKRLTVIEKNLKKLQSVFEREGCRRKEYETDEKW